MLVPQIKSTTILGAGSWGTALALLLAQKNEQVKLWGHNSSHVLTLDKERENKKYLPGYTFPPALQLEATLSQAVAGSECVVMVVPSHGYREVYRQILPHLESNTLVVSAVKGIEIGSRMTMTQVMMDEASDQQKVLGVLSGPSFAKEVASGQPTAVTIAFEQEEAAVQVQKLFSNDHFRSYSSTDVIGLEICGAMKNVIAIGAGIADGLGYGLNTRAALITRGLAEITRLGTALGAKKETFAGLGGLGDLVLTCTGNLSRNRTVGLKLGSGKTLSQAMEEMTMVAEGVKTTKSCYNLSKTMKVETPILEQVYQVLYEDKPTHEAVKDLFKRDLKKEVY